MQSNKRTEKLIESMLSASKSKTPPKIVPVARSSVLDQVKQFLPQLEESNAKLSTTSADLNIENISEDFKDSYIEMNFSYVDKCPEVLASHLGLQDSTDSDEEEEEEEDRNGSETQPSQTPETESKKGKRKKKVKKTLVEEIKEDKK